MNSESDGGGQQGGDLGNSCNSSPKAEFLPAERRPVFVLLEPSSD